MKAFVVRQPIFDQRQRVLAYELCIRLPEESAFAYADSDFDARTVISHSLHVFGFDELTQSKKAFINLTRSLLVQQAAMLLPPDKVVVEILDPVGADDELLRACKVLKQGGYLLALGSYALRPGHESLIGLADIIRVDFSAESTEVRRAAALRFLPRRIQLLAERVETHEDFKEAVSFGYEFFQGFFFCQPEVIARDDISGNKVNYLRLMREINQPDIDFDRIEQIIKQDVALSVKLLRYINSAWFGLSNRVKSIRHALVLLGANVVRQWASLVAVTGLGYDKPSELVTTSLVRANFCERLAPLIQMKGREPDLFLVGLFSSLDALIGRPMEDLLNELAVPNEVRDALLGRPNRLNDVFCLVQAYERGDWKGVSASARSLPIDEDVLPDLYERSVEWVNQVLSG